MWTEIIWLRIGPSYKILWIQYCNSRVHKIQGISGLGKKLLPAQEWFCPMALVSRLVVNVKKVGWQYFTPIAITVLMPGQLDGNGRVNIVGYGWGNKQGEKQYTMCHSFNIFQHRVTTNTSVEGRKHVDWQFMFQKNNCIFSSHEGSYATKVIEWCSLAKRKWRKTYAVTVQVRGAPYCSFLFDSKSLKKVISNSDHILIPCERNSSW
jgi:hypothetical protein